MCVCTPEKRTPWCGKPGCEGPEQHPARHRALYISPEIWLSLLEEGAKLRADVTQNGIPIGAKLVRATYLELRHAFCLIIEHESFEPVPAGRPIPEHPDVQLRRVECSHCA